MAGTSARQLRRLISSDLTQELRFLPWNYSPGRPMIMEATGGHKQGVSSQMLLQESKASSTKRDTSRQFLCSHFPWIPKSPENFLEFSAPNSLLDIPAWVPVEYLKGHRKSFSPILHLQSQIFSFSYLHHTLASQNTFLYPLHSKPATMPSALPPKCVPVLPTSPYFHCHTKYKSLLSATFAYITCYLVSCF